MEIKLNVRPFDEDDDSTFPPVELLIKEDPDHDDPDAAASETCLVFTRSGSGMGAHPSHFHMPARKWYLEEESSSNVIAWCPMAEVQEELFG